MAGVESSSLCVACGTAVFSDAAFCHGCGIPTNSPAIEVVVASKGSRIVGLLAKARNATKDAIQDPDNRRAVKDFVAGTADNAAEIARDVASSPTTKKVAGGALIGAGVAAVLPVISITAGAVAGAALIGYKLLSRNDKD